MPADLPIRRHGRFAVEVELALSAVVRPALFEGVGFRGGRDSETGEGEDQGADADVGRFAFADVAATFTLFERGAQAGFAADSLQRGVEFIAEGDQGFERQSRPPARAQGFDHLGVPDSLRGFVLFGGFVLFRGWHGISL